MLVYAEASRADEVRYLRAALRAAAVGLPQPLALTVSPTPPIRRGRPTGFFG
ncbi:MAG: hypothetical protein WKG07_38640 [Hymenobacter sp.]